MGITQHSMLMNYLGNVVLPRQLSDLASKFFSSSNYLVLGHNDPRYLPFEEQLGDIEFQSHFPGRNALRL